eukprot:6183799-Pleurochrysis_carterae.AAC.1
MVMKDTHVAKINKQPCMTSEFPWDAASEHDLVSVNIIVTAFEEGSSRNLVQTPKWLKIQAHVDALKQRQYNMWRSKCVYASYGIKYWGRTRNIPRIQRNVKYFLRTGIG